MDVRELQAPLKERYRADPGAARITLSARAGSSSTSTRGAPTGRSSRGSSSGLSGTVS